jgi:hypothetical protein
MPHGTHPRVRQRADLLPLAVPALLLLGSAVAVAFALPGIHRVERERDTCTWAPVRWTDFAASYSLIVTGIAVVALWAVITWRARHRRTGRAWPRGLAVTSAILAVFVLLFGFADLAYTKRDARSHDSCEMDAPTAPLQALARGYGAAS